MSSSTGQRYINGRSRVLLFVSEQRRQGTITEPFLCLGFASYVSHEGERPMARCSGIQRCTVPLSARADSCKGASSGC